MGRGDDPVCVRAMNMFQANDEGARAMADYCEEAGLRPVYSMDHDLFDQGIGCTTLQCIPMVKEVAPGCEDAHQAALESPDALAQEGCSLSARTQWDRITMIGPGPHDGAWDSTRGWVSGASLLDGQSYYTMWAREDE